MALHHGHLEIYRTLAAIYNHTHNTVDMDTHIIRVILRGHQARGGKEETKDSWGRVLVLISKPSCLGPVYWTRSGSAISSRAAMLGRANSHVRTRGAKAMVHCLPHKPSLAPNTNQPVATQLTSRIFYGNACSMVCNV